MKKWLLGLVALVVLTSLVIYLLQNRSASGPSGSPADLGTQYPAPAALNFSVVAVYPHDTSSFTQGLVIDHGSLFEGTGEYGHSRLMEVDLKTGKSLRQVSLDDKFFGEGITILHDTVYQLTWQNKVVFVYSRKDFRKIREFPINTEGWGITTDGKNLIVSDGSSNLYFYDPATFRLIRTQGITEAGTLAYNLNELEYIDGYVYANQWQLPYIFKIDPASGQVVAKADLTSIWDRIKAKDPDADVPNGIAYDSTAKKVYITGKKWPELYEVQFSR
ncbi:MAG TPA: glutaminyl-peptide cyclotransferase [Chitinophagaceae bacterium]|nr:glutaminyl-peptide cyclotransferase [Chitinophagaceae bacterium]